MNSSWAGGQANGMYPAHLNQSMYGNLANPQNFDINQFAQTLQNGASSQSGTPQPQPFPNQAFTPGSVVPAKRPHDGMSGSPQQTPQQGSRSQTPSYGGFPNQQAGTPQFPNAPTPYQHLQQPGSNNATPSPTMQNQPFRPPPPQGQQRMNNTSPSPFPGQQQQQQQQHANFAGSPLGPGTPQGTNQMGNMQQQGQMGQFNPQFGAMNPNMAMSMAGMPNAMAAQMNNMQPNPQQAYQMKLLQQQQRLRQSGMLPPRSVGGQQNPMNNLGAGMQALNQTANGGMTPMQAQQQKRNGFMKAIQNYVLQQGRQFNPTPIIGGKPVDLYSLWSHIAQMGGSQQVERTGQWQTVASKMGFTQPQFPTAPEELKQLFITNIMYYERAWMNMRMQQQKQQEARMHAQQMAGFANAQQQSPTKMMQPPAQQQNQYQAFQQNQQNQQPPQTTPVQAHASLPHNGMSTPQQMMNAANNLQQQQQQQQQQHRRNSSLRKPDPVTPQPGAGGVPNASPMSNKAARPPSAKQEVSVPVMKNEEPQSTDYVPQIRSIEWDGGYDTTTLFGLGNAIAASMPVVPAIEEMGVIDIRAITLSLASGIHGEVRYALDVLAMLSLSERTQIRLDLCDDLLDVLLDCAEDQTDILSEEAVEVSDAVDLPSYEDVVRGHIVEADTLQDIPEFGSVLYDLDRAADKVIAITTILRNFSFFEFNHPQLTSSSVVKWLSNTIRLIGTRNMLLRSFRNTQDFYKDVIILLSNITGNLELPTRDDALHVLHFLLCFAPQPSPDYTGSGGKIRFASFSPVVHKYLPPAVDCMAKLLARGDPNRMLYRSIFNASSSLTTSTESPLNLLTRAFALAISVLPDRTKGSMGNQAQLRLVEVRKAYISQGMLSADIITTLAPANNSDLARAWIESEDGWAVGLLNLTALLSVDQTQLQNPAQNPAIAQKNRELGMDYESFKLITYRALTMMKRLAEKAGRGSVHALMANGVSADDDDDHEQPKWEGIPQGHAILGALMMKHTDKVALGLLCGLHDLAMQQA